MSPIDMGKEIEFKFFTDLTKKILKTCKLRLKRKKNVTITQKFTNYLLLNGT